MTTAIRPVFSTPPTTSLDACAGCGRASGWRASDLHRGNITIFLAESDLEPQCSDLARMARREMMPQDTLILITHYPPKLPELPCDEVPENWTFHCVAELVARLQPQVIIQGHVHEWFGRRWRRDKTLIFSASPNPDTLVIPFVGDK